MTKKFLKINRKNFEKSIDIKVEWVYTTYVGRKTTQIQRSDRDGKIRNARKNIERVKWEDNKTKKKGDWLEWTN